jgi:hypothetical protein
MHHVAVLLCLAHLWNWHTVDLGTSDNTTSDWELRASTHEVGVNLASALTTFIDAPVVVLAIVSKYERKDSAYQTMSDCPRRQSPAANTLGKFVLY